MNKYEHPNQDHKLRYIAIGSSAATINILSLSAGFYFLYQLAEDKEWVLNFYKTFNFLSF